MRDPNKTYGFMISSITIVLFFFAIFISTEVLAAGLGSQGWSDSSGGAGDGGTGSLMSLMVALGSTAISWWLAFSSKSPFKDNFLLQMISFLFGPGIIIMAVVYLSK